MGDVSSFIWTSLEVPSFQLIALPSPSTEQTSICYLSLWMFCTSLPPLNEVLVYLMYLLILAYGWKNQSGVFAKKKCAEEDGLGEKNLARVG